MIIKRRDFIKNSLIFSAGIVLLSSFIKSVLTKEKYDIVIYGASSAGIIAAVAAAKRGRSVIIVEPSSHLGGLTTGGLGQTDIGVEGAGRAITDMMKD